MNFIITKNEKFNKLYSHINKLALKKSLFIIFFSFQMIIFGIFQKLFLKENGTVSLENYKNLLRSYTTFINFVIFIYKY